MPVEESSLDDSPLPFNVLQTLEAPDSVEKDFHAAGNAGIDVPPPEEKKVKKRTKLLRKVKSLVNKPKYRLKEIVDSSRQTGEEGDGQVWPQSRAEACSRVALTAEVLLSLPGGDKC